MTPPGPALPANAKLSVYVTPALVASVCVIAAPSP